MILKKIEVTPAPHAGIPPSAGLRPENNFKNQFYKNQRYHQHPMLASRHRRDYVPNTIKDWGGKTKPSALNSEIKKELKCKIVNI
ncbi:MAG: hypothetical protein ABUT20_10690 [Bacteroidota bacterium]